MEVGWLYGRARTDKVERVERTRELLDLVKARTGWTLASAC
jgi:hypothetical protein